MKEAAPSSNTSRRRRAWSESDDDEPLQRLPESSPIGDNSGEMQESDGEVRGGDKMNGDAADDDDDD
ncbi:hypothetical protein F0562_009730 [Nyssa sinensis]|uniref:Uncharacterized protein n=1 Tax=Nyssa sinensis TaxID=561372 RepID=A0A5J5A1V2_9ASTE|nr:hypothetical protein F0562_009730 [Nyssa sinensis]